MKRKIIFIVAVAIIIATMLFFFLREKNDFLEIKKDDDFLITKNFNVKEFFTTCKGHEITLIDKNLIHAVQDLRDEFDSPIKITSSSRPDKDCNSSKGGADHSQHLNNRAIDFKFTEKKAKREFRRLFDFEKINDELEFIEVITKKDHDKKGVKERLIFLKKIKKRSNHVMDIFDKHKVKGVGIYSDHVHLDTRQTENMIIWRDRKVVNERFD